MMDFWLIPISLMLIIVGLFPPIAGYIVLVERKVLADALKLLLKEDIIPSASPPTNSASPTSTSASSSSAPPPASASAPLLGALRSSAQLVSYEVAMALGLLCGVMSAGSLSMVQIVKNQQAQGLSLVRLR